MKYHIFKKLSDDDDDYADDIIALLGQMMILTNLVTFNLIRTSVVTMLLRNQKKNIF